MTPDKHTNMQIKDDLQKRIKELNCLQQIEQFAGNAQGNLNDILQKCVAVLSAAWLHSDSAVAKICLDDNVYQSGNMDTCRTIQTSEINVNGSPCGSIKIGYTQVFAEADEGPFLATERVLIDLRKRRAFQIEHGGDQRWVMGLEHTNQ
ncbi:Uncharacterized protein dnl_44300 [Desulfonema limicola]|uniref:Uncharacterized protein n=1 Tax=Desulfonema limicola TaxID=45656 RepID=A0A975BAR1_9BACT|nr:hypothetical protein [Desulfonema limicola]QTA82066.1 Uncharacterized protein dnl_44300 [Desulfonema limicola]